MGVRDAFNSVSEAIKRNSPDLRTPVTRAYDMGCDAVNAIRGPGVEKVKEYMPDPDVLRFIGVCLNHRATRVGMSMVAPAGSRALNFAAALLYQPYVPSGHVDKKFKQMWSLLIADNERLQADNEKLRAENERLRAEQAENIERLRAENERLRAKHKAVKGLLTLLIALVSFIFPLILGYLASMPSRNMAARICTKPENLITGYFPQIDSSQQ